MKRLIPLVLAVACAPLLALADNTSTETIAPANCKRPTVMANRIRNKAEEDVDFEQRADEYKKCINDYVAVQSAAAQKHQNAANAAIADFNDFAKEANTNKPQE